MSTFTTADAILYGLPARKTTTYTNEQWQYMTDVKSERTIQRALTTLETQGLIVITAGRWEKGVYFPRTIRRS